MIHANVWTLMGDNRAEKLKAIIIKPYFVTDQKIY